MIRRPSRPRLVRWRLFATAILLSAPVFAQTAPPVEPSAAERLDALLASTFEAQLAHDPSLAHRAGDRRSLGRMTVDLSEAHRARSREILESAAVELRSITLHELDPRRRTWAEAFHWVIETNLQLLRQPLHRLPLAPGADLPSEFGRLAGGDGDLALDRAEDLRAYAARAEDLSRWVDLAIAHLRAGAADGLVHPKLVVVRELRALEAMVGGPLEKTVFHRPIEAVDRLGLSPEDPSPEDPSSEDLSTEDAARLRRELTTVTRGVIVPAYARLHAFLRDEYLAEARDGLGLADVPGGDALYRTLVRFYTTTELEPEEIFTLGEEESRRWKKRLRIQLRLGADPRGRFTRDDEQVLQTFRDLEGQVRPRLDRLFLRQPSAPLAIRLVPSHMASVGSAFYSPPPADGSRPGTFFVQPGGFDLAQAEALFLHEALPGHHFQIALARELDDLPGFLRYGYFGAFIEGWGLYAESLGEDLGLYGDPASRLGRIRFALGRAGRLVGDVGLHARGWDAEEARRELGRRDLRWAENEIGRYAVLPAQALSYTVGERKIVELRQRAEEALGDSFDVRNFHAQVLHDGPLPLEVLAAKIERWIERSARADTDRADTDQADAVQADAAASPR